MEVASTSSDWHGFYDPDASSQDDNQEDTENSQRLDSTRSTYLYVPAHQDEDAESHGLGAFFRLGEYSEVEQAAFNASEDDRFYPNQHISDEGGAAAVYTNAAGGTDGIMLACDGRFLIKAGEKLYIESADYSQQVNGNYTVDIDGTAVMQVSDAVEITSEESTVTISSGTNKNITLSAGNGTGVIETNAKEETKNIAGDSYEYNSGNTKSFTEGNSIDLTFGGSLSIFGGGDLSIGMGATMEVNATVAVGIAAVTVDVVGVAAEVTGSEVDLKELAVKLKTLVVTNETLAAKIKQVEAAISTLKAESTTVKAAQTTVAADSETVKAKTGGVTADTTGMVVNI
ncbi:hypothetical protein E1180_02735 [Roseibium denhamense]|uniref:Uncharacterized protein n=1 Tax=Roseibium denhamense TaxID=76305 RepID=A0ABY1NWX0_9HYPH|nr:hypothetical protein [Roseibium denhamense]MTI04432.1 hypothetical protein [Roseibium denhamense]SMP19669.1 hypothetical protein SAMN06265374_2049 [Roseibium denhamense]